MKAPKTKTYRVWYREIGDEIENIEIRDEHELWQVVATARENGIPGGPDGSDGHILGWIMPGAILRIEQIDEDEDLGG